MINFIELLVEHGGSGGSYVETAPAETLGPETAFVLFDSILDVMGDAFNSLLDLQVFGVPFPYLIVSGIVLIMVLTAFRAQNGAR